MKVAPLSLLLLLSGCLAPLKPIVSLEPGVSLKDYRVVVVGAVTDRSGYPFKYKVEDSVRARLVDQLRKDGLTLAPDTTNTAAPILFVVTSIDKFKSGALALQSPNAISSSGCTVSSRLLDGHTGRRLGEIVASELSSDDTQPTSPFGLLMTCARMVAEEIGRRSH